MQSKRHKAHNNITTSILCSLPMQLLQQFRHYKDTKKSIVVTYLHICFQIAIMLRLIYTGAIFNIPATFSYAFSYAVTQMAYKCMCSIILGGLYLVYGIMLYICSRNWT